MTDPQRRQHGKTARAPGRICLAGEGLDWMVGGSSVVAAIDVYTTASFRPGVPADAILISSQEPLFLRRSVRLADLGTYSADELDLLQAIARLAAKRLPGFGPGTLQVRTELPVAAGLGSSAAVTLAAYAALADAHDIRAECGDVCAAAYQAENNELRVGSGWMDFLGCAHGSVSLIDASASPVRHLLARELDAVIILIDTGVRRSTKEALTSHRERLIRADPEILAYIAQTTDVVKQLAEVLTGPVPDYSIAGSLIQDAQTLLRERLMCSTPLVDRVVAISIAAGAYAAKQVGEKGSHVFALCPPSHVSSVLERLISLPVRTKVAAFDTLGLHIDCAATLHVSWVCVRRRKIPGVGVVRR